MILETSQGDGDNFFLHQLLNVMFRTDAQLEYIQRLSELAPEWKEAGVGERGWVSVSCPARSREETKIGRAHV